MLLSLTAACTSPTQGTFTAPSAAPDVLPSKPNSVQGISLWFRCDKTSSLTIDSNGQLSWYDEGGILGALISQSNSYSSSSFEQWNTLNSCLSSGNTNAALKQEPIVKSTTQEYSIFIALNKIKSDGNIIHLSSIGSINEDGFSLSIEANKLVLKVFISDSQYIKKTYDSLPSDRASIIYATISGSLDESGSQLYLNGIKQIPSNIQTEGLSANLSLSLRDTFLFAPPSARLSIAELAIYEKVLSPRTAYSIAKFMGSKWGVVFNRKLPNEVITDSTGSSEEVITYDTIKNKILTPKGCLGCHSSSSKQDNIDLSTYESLISSVSSSSGKKVVRSQNHVNSGLYFSVSGQNPSMPKGGGPSSHLSEYQINLIESWIRGGLKKLSTSGALPIDSDSDNSNNPPPDNSAVDFSLVYYNVISERCLYCHNASTKSGGIDLTNRTTTINSFSGSPSTSIVVPGQSLNSKIYQVVSGVGMIDNKATMPKSTVPLSSQQINLIKSWIDQGAN